MAGDRGTVSDYMQAAHPAKVLEPAPWPGVSDGIMRSGEQKFRYYQVRSDQEIMWETVNGNIDRHGRPTYRYIPSPKSHSGASSQAQQAGSDAPPSRPRFSPFPGDPSGQRVASESEAPAEGPTDASAG